MKCVICDSPSSVISSEPYQNRNIVVRKCSNCEIIFNTDMEGTVSPDYVDIDISDEHIWLQSEHKHEAFNQFLSNIQSIGDLKQCALIDYGCGTGGFIKMLEEQKLHGDFAEIVGVEASEKQVKFAKSTVKSRIILSTSVPVEEINHLSSDTIIVTMWDVLEHVRNPLSFLAEFSKIEKKNVYLFFSVPAAKPMEQKFYLNKMLGRTFSFMPWEHVTYYTPKSIPIVADKLNVKLQKLYPVVCYKRKSSFFEAIRRVYFSITAIDINIHPQLGVLFKIK